MLMQKRDMACGETFFMAHPSFGGHSKAGLGFLTSGNFPGNPAPPDLRGHLHALCTYRLPDKCTYIKDKYKMTLKLMAYINQRPAGFFSTEEVSKYFRRCGLERLKMRK